MSRPEEHRAGVVALLGLPNAGKSTLLNFLLGEKIAAVTAKPQTTRSRILGILNREGAQVLLVDTPGIHDSAKTMNRIMNEVAQEVLEDCDVAILLVDVAAGWTSRHSEIMDQCRSCGTRTFVVGNKGDLPRKKRAPWPPSGEIAAEECRLISARTGEGVDSLLEEIVPMLPVSPPYYPGEEITDRSLRFLTAELIREAAFEVLEYELPYQLGVEIVEFDESREKLIRIRANLVVSRKSQKPIVIGEGGRKIKAIGIAARQQIELLLETKVHLELWVKVEPGWHKKEKRIKAMGYC